MSNFYLYRNLKTETKVGSSGWVARQTIHSWVEELSLAWVATTPCLEHVLDNDLDLCINIKSCCSLFLLTFFSHDGIIVTNIYGLR